MSPRAVLESARSMSMFMKEPVAKRGLSVNLTYNGMKATPNIEMGSPGLKSVGKLGLIKCIPQRAQSTATMHMPVDMKHQRIALENHFRQADYMKTAETPQEVARAIHFNDPKMCVKAVLNLEEAHDISFDRTTTKILDFGCCNGAIGELFASEGFSEIYGQEGSKSKAKRVMERGIYKEVDSFLLGKQRISAGWRRGFDVVTCSDNLKMGLFPATCFTEMMRALKPGGILVFTIADKYLNEETDLGMGYR